MTNDELLQLMQAERAVRSPEEVRRRAEILAEVISFGENDRANPNTDGWVRLCGILKEAKQDKRIASSCGASEFLELMFELAADALPFNNAEAALEPVTGELKALVRKLRKESRSR